MSPSHVGDRSADPYYQCVSWLHERQADNLVAEIIFRKSRANHIRPILAVLDTISAVHELHVWGVLNGRRGSQD